MPAKSASKIAAWIGPAIPPGELLLEEYFAAGVVGQKDR